MYVNTFFIGTLLAYSIITYFIIFICVFVVNLLSSWRHRWRVRYGFKSKSKYIWDSNIECMMFGLIWPLSLLIFIFDKLLENPIKSVAQFIKQKVKPLSKRLTQPILLRLFLSKKEYSLFREQQVQKALGTIDTMYTNERK